MPCIDYCEYEDCSQEFGVESCWKENCDDGCNNRNCSIYQQFDGQWVGETCEVE